MYAPRPPIVIGAVSEAPIPVVEMVSGAGAVVTEVSVVGKAALPNDGATAALPAAGVTALIGGCGAAATTDSSVVGNIGGALAAGEPAGEGETAAVAFAGSGLGSTVSRAIASC